MNDHNLMNDHNKSFYPLDMFEFIHHPEYGCHDLKGLIHQFQHMPCFLAVLEVLHQRTLGVRIMVLGLIEVFYTQTIHNQFMLGSILFLNHLK
jgi:hypothetical protein